MQRVKLIYVFVLLISNISYATICKSVKTGNWSNSSTWEFGVLPSQADTVIISMNDSVFINTSSGKSEYLILNGTLYFKSSSNSLEANSCLVQDGTITGNQLGLFKTKNLLISSKLVVNKINLTVEDSLINKGLLEFNSTSGNKSVATLLNHGEISNPAGEKLFIKNDLINLGVIDFSLGDFHFNNSSRTSKISSKNNILINELLIDGAVKSKDSITVISKISGLGLLKNQGVLTSLTSNGNFSIKTLDLSEKPNTLILARNGQQSIPSLKSQIASTIVLKGSGNHTSIENLTIDSVIILNNSQLKLNHNWTGETIINDKSVVSIGINGSLNNFKKINFSEFSMLKLLRNYTPTRNIQLGNLTIDANIELNLTQVDTLFLSGSSSGTGKITNSNTIVYNGSTKQSIEPMNYNNLIINNSSYETQTLLGSYFIDNLKIKKGKFKPGNLTIENAQIDTLGIIEIGGSSPSFTDSLIVNGGIFISSNLASPTFNTLIIGSNGEFNNKSSSDVIITSSLQNHGNFIGCLGTACDYSFTANPSFTLGTKEILIPRLNGPVIHNSGFLTIAKELKVDSFYNHSSATLSIEADSQNITGHFEFSEVNNNVIFQKEGNQIIPSSFIQFENVTFKNYGEKVLSKDLIINKNLWLTNESILKMDSFDIIGNTISNLIIDSLSTLIIGHNFSSKNIQFPRFYSKSHIYLHDYSTVKYASKSNQSISGIPSYGNLIIDDGAVDSCEKVLVGDSLIVNGNMKLEESSMKFILNDKTTRIKGDWNGSGKVKLSTSNFYLGGNGNADGTLSAGKSNFIYNGNQLQRIKVAHYYDLTIDKENRAFTKANAGQLIVENEARVKKGTLDFDSELCYLNLLSVEDSVIFSSKYQEKTIHDLNISSSGIFLLDYDEEVFISGDIVCNGCLKSNNGIIHFIDSINNQVLSGTGEIQLSKVEISKKESQLTFETDVNIIDTLHFNSGSLKLSSSVVKLSNKGYISNESSINSIHGKDKSFIKSIQFLAIGEHKNINGLGVSLNTRTPLGITKINRGFKSHELDGNESINRYYEIEPSFNIGLHVDLTFNYFDHELNKNDENELKVWKSIDDGSNWLERGGFVIPENNQVQLNAISSFSHWSAGAKKIITLPVELFLFKGEREDDLIKVEWVILSETNTKAYQLNLSYDGIHFDSLTTVNAENITNYEFNFHEIKNQIVYIELIEIEQSNQSNRLDTILIYPSIGNAPKAWIEGNRIITKNFTTGTVELYDTNGKLVQSNKMDISGLPKACYFIYLRNEIGFYTFKIWKN